MGTDFLSWLRQLKLIAEMDLFEQYLEVMEGFLETEAQKYRERLKDLREETRAGKRITQPSFVTEEDVINLDLQMLDHFTNILRKSFFVGLYTFLESRLMEICRSQKRADSSQPLSDIPGKGIYKAKTYLVKVLGINFPFDTNPEWKEIQDYYRRLRNCIVHNEGRLDEGMKSKEDLEALRDYVARKQTLSLPGKEIILHRDFCKEALDTIRKFFDSLLTSTNVQD